MRNVSAHSERGEKNLIVLEKIKDDFFQISMEKYTDYRFEEPDHGKERECLPFSSLAITDHTKFQLK